MSGKPVWPNSSPTNFRPGPSLKKWRKTHFFQSFIRLARVTPFRIRPFFCSIAISSKWSSASRICLTKIPIADYLFAKDKIFATLTLSSEELNLYQQIYALLNTQGSKAGPCGLSPGSTRGALQKGQKKG